MNIQTPGAGAARYIGKRVLRKEDPRLLTGRGQYVDDIVLPGMLHVAFARSPIARGKIVSIDTSAARDLPGVQAVYTAKDLAAVNFEMQTLFMSPLPVRTTPLAEDHVAYVGDPVALVVADNRYIAEDAASLIAVEYDEEDPVVSITDAKTGAPVHPGTDTNISAEMGEEQIAPDLAAKLEGAAHLISQTVIHQRVAHSSMETRGIVVAREGPEELTIYISCQSPHLVARWVSTALGLPDAAIRVIAKDVGGAFGLKNQPWKEESAVLVAGMLYGRPLKWIEDRYENLIAANQSREQEMTLQLAFDEDCKLVAGHGVYDLNNGAYPHGPDHNGMAHIFMWSAYKLPVYGFLSRGWYTNTVGVAAYRGPWAMESLVRETLLDKAARQIGIDPIELRRRNLVSAEDQPMTTATGLTITDATPLACLEKLLENFDVAAFRKEQEAKRKEGRYLGLGIVTYVEPTAFSGGMDPMTGELAQVRIEPNGKVTAMMSTHSQGHGTATTMAQLVADRLGVRYEDVTVFEGDSSRGGFGPGAGGSRQAVNGGGAAIKASEMLADKVKVVAAHLLNASVESITISEGMIHVEGAEEMTRSLGEIAKIAYAEPNRLPAGLETGLEMQYRYQPPPITFASAAHACVVEVDADTGFVEIKRWISTEDCGTVINPAIVEGQISGGLAQGIGMVLLEEISYDERGNPKAATFKDYMLPSITDIPVFEFLHASTPSPSIGGMRGVGEGGAIIGPPTLFNAIADALSPFGELPVDLPLTPAKILDMIEGRDISGTAARRASAAAAE